MWTKILCFLHLSSFLFHTCDGQLQNILNYGYLPHSENLVEQLLRLLESINYELQYDYIVLVKEVSKSSSCTCEDSIRGFNKPLIITSGLIENNSLELKHSGNFLLLSCSLKYLNGVRILNTVYQYVPHIIWSEEALQEREKLCLKMHADGYFQNLIVTRKSLKAEDNFWSCDLKKRLKSADLHSFTKPHLNLQGLSITTESDQLPPRSILYYNAAGQLQITGFVANYLTTFAERYKAKLLIKPPANIGVTVHYNYLANRTFHGILDIAAVVARYKVDSLNESYSYPVELMEYCYMIPLPHVRPAHNVFFDIIEVEAVLIILIYFIAFAVFLNIGQHKNIKHLSFTKLVCSDKSFRGLLSQSFVMPRKSSLFMKYILFLLCYSSILLCTSYQAYLQSHLVHPSLEKRMESYEDIRKNNFKILVDDQESMYVNPEILNRNHDLFVREKNFDSFLKLRDSMDTRYIFPVSQTRWSVFHERQKIFQRKLFYYSSQLCLDNLVLLSFPLRPGLPYKLQFNQHLLDIRDAGLLDCWLERNFLVMVRLKLSSFKDLSVVDEYGPRLDLDDFLYIWIAYAACILISSSVFIGELLFHKMKYRRNHTYIRP